MAAEAIIKPFIGIDAEGWALFGVEGTKPHPSAAFFCKPDMVADHRDDVGLVQDFLDESIRNSSHQPPTFLIKKDAGVNVLFEGRRKMMRAGVGVDEAEIQDIGSSPDRKRP